MGRKKVNKNMSLFLIVFEDCRFLISICSMMLQDFYSILFSLQSNLLDDTTVKRKSDRSLWSNNKELWFWSILRSFQLITWVLLFSILTFAFEDEFIFIKNNNTLPVRHPGVLVQPLATSDWTLNQPLVRATILEKGNMHHLNLIRFHLYVTEQQRRDRKVGENVRPG